MAKHFKQVLSRLKCYSGNLIKSLFKIQFTMPTLSKTMLFWFYKKRPKDILDGNLAKTILWESGGISMLPLGKKIPL